MQVGTVDDTLSTRDFPVFGDKTCIWKEHRVNSSAASAGWALSTDDSPVVINRDTVARIMYDPGVSLAFSRPYLAAPCDIGQSLTRSARY
jgi:hypothetical protein